MFRALNSMALNFMMQVEDDCPHLLVKIFLAKAMHVFTFSLIDAWN